VLVVKNVVVDVVSEAPPGVRLVVRMVVGFGLLAVVVTVWGLLFCVVVVVLTLTETRVNVAEGVVVMVAPSLSVMVISRVVVMVTGTPGLPGSPGFPGKPAFPHWLPIVGSILTPRSGML